MSNGAELQSDETDSLRTTNSQAWDISQLIITAAKRAIGMIDINCDRVEVPFDPEVTKQLASIGVSTRDSAFRTAAKVFTDRDEGWHSVALAEDGRTLVLDRTGDISTLVPYLNERSQGGSQFHIYHSAVDTINNEEFIQTAMSAIRTELSQSTEDVPYHNGTKLVTLGDKKLTRRLARMSDSTFTQIAKKLIEESSGQEGTQPFHTVALSPDGTMIFLFNDKIQDSIWPSLKGYRVFMNGKRLHAGGIGM